MYLPYVFAQIRRLFSIILYESSVSFVTGAIRFLKCFLNKWIWKKSISVYCTSLPKEETSRDNVQKKKESPYMELSPGSSHIRKHHMTMTRKETYRSNNVHLQNHSLKFIDKNQSFLLATSVLFGTPVVYETTASLDKLTCTDYVDFV